jgi:hypothetical protein
MRVFEISLAKQSLPLFNNLEDRITCWDCYVFDLCKINAHALIIHVGIQSFFEIGIRFE